MRLVAALTLIALAGCGEKKDPPPTRPALVVEPPSSDQLATTAVATNAVILVKADGSVTFAVIDPAMLVDGALDLATVHADPVEPEALAAMVAAVPLPPLPPPEPEPEPEEEADDEPYTGPDILYLETEEEAARSEVVDVARRAGALAADAHSRPCGPVIHDVEDGPYEAGLRIVPFACTSLASPLVLADAAAPAAALIRVLSSVPSAVLGVSRDDPAHVRTLEAQATFLAGDQPAATTPEVAVTLGPTLSALSSDPRVPVRLRVDGDRTAGELVAAIVAILRADVTVLAIGERSAYLEPESNLPGVRFGVPTGSFELDQAVLRRFVRHHAGELTGCYEPWLAKHPGLEGVVDVQFVISPMGKAGQIHAEGVSAAVSTCVAAVIKTIEFPKPKSGGPIDVTSYPMTFRPTGG